MIRGKSPCPLFRWPCVIISFTTSTKYSTFACFHYIRFPIVAGNLTMSDRICILHTNDADQNNVPVKAFTPETWEETASTVNKRRARPSGSKSKYRAICYDLPDSFSENIGYHSTCYKRFTSVTNSAIELSSQEN